MMKKGKPEKIKNDSSLPDDDIIELTETLDDGDDDVIELTDAVEDDDVIELNEIAEDKASASAVESSADQGGNLEYLREVSDDSDLDAGELLDMLGVDEEEEDAVDLLDAVEESEEDAVDLLDAIGDSEDASIESDDAAEHEKTLELEEEQLVMADEDMEDVSEASDGDVLESLDTLDVLDDTEEEEMLVDSAEDLDRLDSDEAVEEKSAVSSGSSELDEELLELIEDINGTEEEVELEEVILESDEVDELSDDDLLEPDEEIDISAHESEEDLEESQVFAASLGDDLGSVLDSQGPEEDDIEAGDGLLDRPGVISVQVENQREDGPPVDFTFQSKLYPGDKVYRENSYTPSGGGQVSRKQLEETVKKVVKDLVGEKIDDMIVDIIEKTVAEEIQRLKDFLRGNLDADTI